jgi:hypothetical protein
MYPNSLGYDYILSNGKQNFDNVNNLNIGCVYNFVDTMYIGWSYFDVASSTTKYGLDRVNNSSSPAPNFNWRSLIWDGGVDYKTKEANRMQITFNSFPSDATLYPFYNVNRGGDVISTISAQAGDQKVVFELGAVRFHELQWGFIGTASGNTAPVITGVTMEISPLPEEVGMSSNVNE